ncbi:MAG: DNA repair protein RecN [Dehalococcoidia bacterium]
MLQELDIRNVAVAEHVRLTLGDGFIALTGETGAGKSIVIDALAMLLGGPTDTNAVRAGADRARIEGVFQLPTEPDEAVLSALEEAGIEPEDGVLIVSREVPAQGRSVARINGRAVVQATLRAIGARLVDIHGQEDQLSIFRTAEHLGYLDRYGHHSAERAAVASMAGELRSLRAELRRLTDDARERARRQDRLRFEVDEIESADLTLGEEDDLRAERQLLANAEELGRLAEASYAALVEGEDGASAVDALGVAASALSQLGALDPRHGALAEQAEALQSQATELAREVRAYRDEVEADPDRLQQIEERLTLLTALKRKYGQSIEEVLAYAERAVADLEALDTSEERAEGLAAEIEAVAGRLAAAARHLSELRRATAARLSAEVEREIAGLGLRGGRFAVHFARPASDDGVATELPEEELIGPEGGAGDGPERQAAFDRTGIDRVEFYVSLNPGEPLRPLARVASGGESARLMLALKTILGAADSVPTLVFDEVDVGIGGRSGQVVGEKLAALGTHHQVLCITHLPQVAARAGQHLAVSKFDDGQRTFTEIRELDSTERVQELAAMLGGVTEPNLRSAEAMLGSEGSNDRGDGVAAADQDIITSSSGRPNRPRRR